jgi:hypothetical protein
MLYFAALAELFDIRLDQIALQCNSSSASRCEVGVFVDHLSSSSITFFVVNLGAAVAHRICLLNWETFYKLALLACKLKPLDISPSFPVTPNSPKRMGLISS